MATTTNFGWTTPDDTDLVKDGAAAIRTLGSSIDTSLVDLKGGTTGQNLRKASNTDLDFTFAGDATNTVVDAAGDLLYGTANDTLGKLSIGTAGQVLQVNSGATAPEWVTAAAGGLTLISTATPSAATTVSFTSIPTTFKTLLVKYVARQSSNSDYFSVQLNGQASGHNWKATAITGNNTTILSFTGSNEASFTSSSRYSPIPPCATTDTADQAMGYFHIFDANISQIRHQVAWQAVGIGSVTQFINAQGYMDLSSAGEITQIDFVRSSTQNITGTFYLYGAF